MEMIEKSRHRVGFDFELFNIHGHSIEFQLAGFDVVETACYNKIIEAFGGKLSTLSGPRTVLLVDPSHMSESSSDCYDIQFIKDSILTQKLQELEDYRITSYANEDLRSDCWGKKRSSGEMTMNSGSEHFSCQSADELNEAIYSLDSISNSDERQSVEEKRKLVAEDIIDSTEHPITDGPLDIKPCLIQLSTYNSTNQSTKEPFEDDYRNLRTTRRSTRKVVQRVNAFSTEQSVVNRKKSKRVRFARCHSVIPRRY